MSKQEKFHNIDAFVEWYKSMMPREVHLLKNKPRYDEVHQAIKDIVEILENESMNYTIVTEPCPLLPCDFDTSIIIDELIVRGLGKFCKALAKANVLNVYPISKNGNQKLRIDISFYGLFDEVQPYEEIHIED